MNRNHTKLVGGRSLVGLQVVFAFLAVSQSAAAPPLFIRRDQLSATVTETHAYNSATGKWKYTYIVANHPDSLQKAWFFAIQVSGDPIGTISPTGWSFFRVRNRAALTWAATEPAPRPSNFVDDGSIPLSLHAIPPNAALTGFGFESSFPPGDVRFWVQGESESLLFDEEEVDQVSPEDVAAQDYMQNSFKGWTVGPVPPDSCAPPAANGSSCDDGYFCNGTDSCLNGHCSEHSGYPCVGPDGDSNCAESCDEIDNACTGSDPNESPCVDSNPCTEDSCNVSVR